MIIRCLIIDDAPLALDLLTDYIKKLPFLELVDATVDPLKGLAVLKEKQIDLVFLDIQMPELSGLQFMKIAGEKCKVILTTAYPEYALDGYEFDVIDYLLKPVSFERFYRAADKALNYFSIQKPTDIQPASIKRPDHLFVKTDGRIQKINLSDILYVESLQNYIRIHTHTDQILSLQPLKRIEADLPGDDFVRVHKSFLVAIRQIKSIERDRISIGHTVIPIGSGYKEQFQKSIRQQF